MASQNVEQKREFFKNGPFAMPSYNLYFLPLMTGQTELTIVAVVYVLGYIYFKSRTAPTNDPISIARFGIWSC